MDDNDSTYPSEKLIEAYLLGVLPEEKRAVLEQRMADDPEIAKKIMLHRKVEQTLRFARKQRLNEQFLAHFDGRERIGPTEEEAPALLAPKRGNFIRWAAAAALLLVCVAGAFFIGEKIGREQAAQTPTIIRDTIFLEKTSDGPKEKTPFATEDPDKEKHQATNEEVNKKRSLIAALHRPPEKEKERGMNGRLRTDTLVLINDLWKSEKYSDLVRLARPYVRNHQLPAEMHELYADAEFKVGNYGAAESAYLELTEVTAIRKEAQWNLLLCYAVRWPEKKSEFDKLAGEIEGWSKPNRFEKDLARLRKWVETL